MTKKKNTHTHTYCYKVSNHVDSAATESPLYIRGKGPYRSISRLGNNSRPNNPQRHPSALVTRTKRSLLSCASAGRSIEQHSRVVVVVAGPSTRASWRRNRYGSRSRVSALNGCEQHKDRPLETFSPKRERERETRSI